MNRIILIGNGFDLAHGLKTSYKDFIDDFWIYEEDNVQAWYNKFCTKERPYTANKCCEPYKDEFICISFEQDNFLYNPIGGEGYRWFVVNRKRYHNFECKNKFLETISEKTTLQDWVDIECEYYLALNECLNDTIDPFFPFEPIDKKIKKLNDDFFSIKHELLCYLENMHEDAKQSPEIKQHIYSDLKREDFHLGFSDTPLERILFLNFNYTNTEKLYVVEDKCDVIHIHGELGDHEDKIVFGYGDEIGDEYKRIENRNNNDYLKNIKSIRYSNTNNYKRLLNFIDFEEYQIFVMGHSCGISDRVLLNMLFEHKNCVSIKVFYHKKHDGSDNFSDVISNISRNFTDKTRMRKIIVDKENSEPLPQSQIT